MGVARRLGLLSFVYSLVFTSWAEEKHALVIGNSDYEHLGKLKNPVNDVELISLQLEKVGFAVTPVFDATIDEMDKAVGSFIETLDAKGENAIGILYYAGHGVQSEGVNYLIPVDFSPDQLFARYTLNANDVLARMEQAANAVDIMVLDACRDNPLPSSTTRSLSRGMAKMEAAEGSLIVYSTQPGNVALDGRGEYSPFAEVFAAEILTEWDRVASMVSAVTAKVYERTDKKQRPWLASSLTGAFSFTPRQLITETDEEAEFWRIVVTQDTPALYQTYLKQYPNGRFSDAARGIVVERSNESETFEPPSPIVAVAASSPGAFRDELRSGGTGPEMVIVRTGHFRMGDSAGVDNFTNWEVPVHNVTIATSFALSTHEVTFEEYHRFTQATGRQLPDDQGWGRGRRPVIHVSWEEANQYTEWLSSQTEKRYRLPTEAEWEYAARAGSTTKYHTGDTIAITQANVARTQTVEVGSYAPNGFDLFDMHGNVMEWTADCWNESYAGAPDDGSVWTTGNCRSRVLRGGSWSTLADAARSASRTLGGGRHYDVGFRVAQDL